MKLFSTPALTGFAAGVLFAFSGAAVLIFYARDGGVGQDAIGNALGAGIGAMVTVIGTHLVQKNAQNRITAAHARLVLGNLEPARVSMAQCAHMLRALEMGVPVAQNLLHAADGARKARDSLGTLIQSYATTLDGIVAPGIVARDTLDWMARAVEARNNYQTRLARMLVGESIEDRAHRGFEAIEAVASACRRSL